MSLLRIGANGPLIRLANGGFISTSASPPAQTAPGVVATLAASSVTQTGLTLQWSASTGSTPITYAIYQKLHSGSTYTSVGTTANTTFPITGLQSATQYDFYVVASNSVGTASNGNVVSTFTSGQPPTAPSNIDTATIINITQNGFTIAWQAPSGTQPITYTPQYKLHSDSVWTSLSTTTALAANVAGLTATTQYDARVLASNSAGSTSTGTSTTATTSGITTGGAPGPLAGINFTQPYPIHPDSYFNSVGFATPVDGIGPFVITLTGNPNGAYRTFVDTWDGHSYTYDNRTIIQATNPGTTTDQITLQCVDARGDQVSGTFTINKTSGTVTAVTMNNRNPNYNINPTDTFANGPFYTPQVVSPGGSLGYFEPIQIKDTTTGLDSTNFQVSYGAIRIAPNACPPGTYPVEVTMSNGTITLAPFAYTIQMLPIPTPFIDWTIPSVSTSTAVGTQFGTAKATTIANLPKWFIIDPTDTFEISIQTGAIRLRTTPTTTDSITIQIKVTDYTQTATKSFVIPISTGTVVPSTNMTMSIPSNLVNVGRNQVVGTPTVSGISGTKLWTMTQDNENLEGRLTNGYRDPFTDYTAHFAIDSSTGAITAPGLLGAKTYHLTVTCSNGVNSCTRVFAIPVAWAPTTTTYYVGRGMAAAHPGIGYETMAEVKALCQGNRTDTAHVYVMADADPDYYASDNGTRDNNYGLRFAWTGPIIIEGVAANGVDQPRLGGSVTSYRGGSDMRGKGFMTCGDGDFILKNLHFSHSLGDYGIGLEATRKDGACFGNYQIENCRFEYCDNGIESGAGCIDVRILNTEVVGCGSSVVGSGITHNLYIGLQWSLYVDGLLSVMTEVGHELKTRCFYGTIKNSRFYDLERGHASAQIDMPNGCAYTIDNCKFHKGAMADAPHSVQFAREFDSSQIAYQAMPRHSLSITNSSFWIAALDGSHYGTPSAINAFAQTDTFGNPSMNITADNNSFYLSPRATVKTEQTVNSLPPPTITLTNSTILTVPPALDLTRPALSGSFPTIPWKVFVWQGPSGGDDSFDEYNAVQINPGFDDKRIPASTAIGAVLGVCDAFGNYADNRTGTPPGTNPFGPGSTWNISQDGVYYSSPPNDNPWAPVGRYGITTHSDGTATLTVTGTLTPGVDVIQLRVVGPTGTICKNRFYVAVI